MLLGEGRVLLKKCDFWIYTFNLVWRDRVELAVAFEDCKVLILSRTPKNN